MTRAMEILQKNKSLLWLEEWWTLWWWRKQTWRKMSNITKPRGSSWQVYVWNNKVVSSGSLRELKNLHGDWFFDHFSVWASLKLHCFWSAPRIPTSWQPQIFLRSDWLVLIITAMIFHVANIFLLLQIHAFANISSPSMVEPVHNCRLVGDRAKRPL